MNRKIATALILAATAAGSAFAESPIGAQPDNFTSTRTRAEVQAELHSFKQAGVDPWSFQYNNLHEFRGTLTREQVLAEYFATREEMAAIHSEDGGAAYFGRKASARQTASATLVGQPSVVR